MINVTIDRKAVFQKAWDRRQVAGENTTLFILILFNCYLLETGFLDWVKAVIKKSLKNFYDQDDLDFFSFSLEEKLQWYLYPQSKILLSSVPVIRLFSSHVSISSGTKSNGNLHEFCREAQRKQARPFPLNCTACGLKTWSKLDIKDKCYETDNRELKPKICHLTWTSIRFFCPEVRDCLPLHNHISLKNSFTQGDLPKTWVVIRSCNVHFPKPVPPT